MNKIIFIESKSEKNRYIFAIHLAKVLSKKKSKILILDTNQINNFLNFPKMICNLKFILSEEPYKIKISTIANNTDILKIPNDLFFEIDTNANILKKINILINYLLEKYDYIISTGFINNNDVNKVLIDNSFLIFDINEIKDFNEREIIEKIKNINLNSLEYKIIFSEYDKNEISNLKMFLNYKKIFLNNLISETIYFDNFLNNISFINKNIYNKETIKNISKILIDINFYIK